MFATTSGNVRRNALSDFTNVMRNGKIAMKLNEGDRLVGVAVCDDSNDVLLSTQAGKAIRFPVGDVRVFAGRSSVGVRGVRLGKDDAVISMTILHHMDFDTETRDAYLKLSRKLRGMDEDDAEAADEAGEEPPISEEDFARMAQGEEFILTVTRKGYGKRTSAYEYRITKRGGQGVTSIATNKRNGNVAAAFPVDADDEAMMITDAGKVIRIPVGDIRIAGRATQGVTLFSTSDDETVMSVAHLKKEDEAEVDADANAEQGVAPGPDDAPAQDVTPTEEGSSSDE
jgi:DNA gyrase subunit A